jgi:hypothetical protein
MEVLLKKIFENIHDVRRAYSCTVFHTKISSKAGQEPRGIMQRNIGLGEAEGSEIK